MTWLARLRRRRALLREAEALEAQARGLRRPLVDTVGRAFGWGIAAAVLAAATAAEFDPQLRPYARIVTEPRGPVERAAELEAQAKAKREEAGRL